MLWILNTLYRLVQALDYQNNFVWLDQQQSNLANIPHHNQIDFKIFLTSFKILLLPIKFKYKNTISSVGSFSKYMFSNFYTGSFSIR